MQTFQNAPIDPPTAAPENDEPQTSEEITESVDDAEGWEIPDTPLRLRTKFAFAVTTALGGMLLGTGADTGSLAVFVVLFSAIGFLCVDWLKLFALPSLIAYAAMALTAVVCVADFVQDGELLGTKMVAVGQLLAVAQSILMMQEKNHRLFEQLLTFALLNCIVAAVFNDAFSYALWFVPLTMAGGLALAFLAADETVTLASQTGYEVKSGRDETSVSTLYVMDNSAAVRSFSEVAVRLPWTSMVVVVPAVAAVGAAIFFALPRKVEASRGASTEALVGFNDTVRLGQIGRMQMSSERAMRVSLIDAGSKSPYPAVDGIYLRGRTLERYVADREISDGGGSWESVPPNIAGPIQPLPPQYVPARESDKNFFDRVFVSVNCESMRSPALFAIAPYHRKSSESILTRPYQWILLRKQDRNDGSSGPWFPRIDYSFATQAFRDGVQSPWIGDLSMVPPNRGDEDLAVLDAEVDERIVEAVLLDAAQLDYSDRLLDYPEQVLPTARVVAEEVINGLPLEKRNPVSIARRLEQHLAMSNRYEYTLNLDSPVVSGMDPVEQFLSIDRRGHCQYFAASLAMMLRSQGIPARLVVGYHCDEFNDLTQVFTVRQSHAHAWVEALIDRKDVPLGESVYGQPESKRYWLRLDPTPGGGGVVDGGQVGGGRQIAELAQNFWNDYVVEMNPQVQKSTLLSTPGFAPMTNSYQSWIEEAKALAVRINTGDVSGIGGGQLFSKPAAIATIVLAVVVLAFVNFQFPSWFRRGRRRGKTLRVARPSIDWYAEALDLLERAGFVRQNGQTPAELTASLPDESLRRPMAELTQWFYRQRYREGAASPQDEHGPQTSVLNSLQQIRSEIAHRESLK